MDYNKLIKDLEDLKEKVKLNDERITAIADLLMNISLWKLNLISPFHTAYIGAFENFKSVLQKSEQERKRKIEAAFLALSLCGGSVLTAVLGGLTLTQIAGNHALRVICERNMEKTFDLLARVEGSPVEKFIIGQAAAQVKN